MSCIHTRKRFTFFQNVPVSRESVAGYLLYVLLCYVLYFPSLPPFLLYLHTRTSLLVHPPFWAETPTRSLSPSVISAARADLLVVMGGVNIWVLLKSSHPSPALSACWHTFSTMLPNQGFQKILSSLLSVWELMEITKLYAVLMLK